MAENPKDEADAIIKLGRILWRLRQQAGLSRAKLATRARISQGTIKVIESGRHRPRLGTLLRILGAMRLPQSESAELLKLLEERNPQHVQVELKVIPLAAEGEEIGEVVTIRFFLIPSFKRR